MVPIKIRLDNDDHYDGNLGIKYIVIHDTGNKTDSDQGNANYFCTGTRNASANYFVDNDSITQVVLDKNSSFHCGDGAGKYGITNKNSLAIEMCKVNGLVTATTEANCMDLVKMKMVEHNIPASRVVRHYDASHKNCPAGFNLDGKWTRWITFKARLSVAVAPKPAASTQVYRIRKTWADVASQIGAFSDLALAKACVNSHAGFEAYNASGVLVYPVAVKPVVAAKPVIKYPIAKTVIATTLNVRSGHGTNFGIIGEKKKGEKVKVAGPEVNGFSNIYFGNAGGWVSSEFLK